MMKIDTLRPAPRPSGLSAEDCVPAAVEMDFATTDELTGESKVMPQPRACAALEVGLSITRRDFHVFLAGPSGTGRRLLTMQILADIAPKRATPPDRLFVHDFDDDYTPCVVSLPAGQGLQLRKALLDTLEHLEETLPATLDAPDHQERLQRLAGKLNRSRAAATLELRREALALGFAVELTDEGQLNTLPLVDGEPIDDRALLDMPQEEQAALEERREQLDPVISAFAHAHHIAETEARDAMSALHVEFVREVAEPAVAALRERFVDIEGSLARFFDGLEAWVVDEHELFLGGEEREEQGGDPFVCFRATLVVDNSRTEGAPIIMERQPSFYRLFGKIERRMGASGLGTDHTMLHGGSLAEANGGYLILHADDVFSFPQVWDHLKLCLRNREVAITDMGESAGMVPTSGLRPEALPLDVKVILVGSNHAYHALHEVDRDFRELFRVKAEFDDEIPRVEAHIPDYVSYIAGSVRHNDVRPVTAAGVNVVLEHSSRAAGSQRKLTLRANVLGNLLVEADHVAGRSGAEVIDAEHVREAIEGARQRGTLLADKLHEQLCEGSLLIAADGARIGVVNGMAVYSSGEHSFGMPVRVTARCFAGRAGLVSIEQEAELSGQIHDKSVHLVAGFLGGLFATEEALAFTATIAFEQNYSMIDGDSAASTVLYAIISDLAGVAIDQSVAVTGSINQLGEIQAVGGVHDKIEGFFRYCEAMGLTGRQGVIIPEMNARDLVLDGRVRDAIAAGQFHVWPITAIEEGLEILTGVAAGTPERGEMPAADTVLGRAAARLAALREAAVKSGPWGRE